MLFVVTSVKIIPSSSVTVVGDMLNLTCIANVTGNGTLMFRWIGPMLHVPGTVNFTGNTTIKNLITLGKVNHRQNGNYTCTVYYGSSVWNDTFNLLVIGMPTIIK